MTRPEPSILCMWCGKPVSCYPPVESGWLIHIECYEQWERKSRKNKAKAKAILQAEANRRQAASINLQAGAISAEGETDVRINQTRNEVIPVGEYVGQIMSVEEDTEGQFGPQLKYEWAIVGGEYANVTLRYWTSQSFSTKSKLYGLVKAIMGGRDIEPDFTLDTDWLIGKQARLVVITKPDKDGNGEFNRIDSVLPLRATAAAPRPAPRPAAAAPAGVKPAPRPTPVAEPEPDGLPPTDWDKVMAEPS